MRLDSHHLAMRSATRSVSRPPVKPLVETAAVGSTILLCKPLGVATGSSWPGKPISCKNADRCAVKVCLHPFEVSGDLWLTLDEDVPA
jgi:hypothetical protein